MKYSFIEVWISHKKQNLKFFLFFVLKNETPLIGFDYSVENGENIDFNTVDVFRVLRYMYVYV